jgi:prepilin-type N-terminal cleavage/methylation domain-containing protein
MKPCVGMPQARSAGFSLLEMMISVAVLFVIAGGAFSAMVYSQKSYQGTSQRVYMHAGVRGAAELMAQEIGQAGAGPYSGTGEVGVYPTGIYSVSATTLSLYGDMNSDGNLWYIQYVCDGTTNHTLTRSATCFQGSGGGCTVSSTLATAVTLVDNVYANPGGTNCFQSSTTTAGSYTIVSQILFTITVQTPYVDPQTGSYVTMTKSLLNLAPRNMMSAIELANVGMTNRLLSTPTSLPH